MQDPCIQFQYTPIVKVRLGPIFNFDIQITNTVMNKKWSNIPTFSVFSFSKILLLKFNFSDESNSQAIGIDLYYIDRDNITGSRSIRAVHIFETARSNWQGGMRGSLMQRPIEALPHNFVQVLMIMSW